MIAVLLTVHTLIVLALIGFVLLQRSDGGALGIGGGGTGGLMTGRGAANALTRTTSILAFLFFSTSIGLAIMAGSGGDDEESIIESLTAEDAPLVPLSTDPLGSIGAGDENAPISVDVLDALGAGASSSGDGDEAPADDETSDGATQSEN
ncbi:MAG: preprotein translocase subunit SecG [Pseudomonadota bacterium]